MKIIEAGGFINYEGIESIDFFSNQYFIDASILLVRLSGLIEEIEDIQEKNDGVLSKEVVAYWKQRRKSDIESFYEHGGVVVLLLDSKPIKYFENSGYQKGYHELNFLEVFTDTRMNLNSSEGNSVIAVPTAKNLHDICDIKFYTTFWSANEEIKPLFTTIKRKELVSFSMSIKNGVLVALPDISPKVNYEISREDRKLTFLDAILDLVDSQKSHLKDILLNPPEWINSFSFTIEEDQRIELSNLNQKKQALELKIFQVNESLDKYNLLKSILYTKGTELEFGIRECLTHLGIEFITPKGSNTDLIIKNEEQYFAIEIKGGTGSATKQHVRQLEEWVNSCASTYNLEEAKGILIINPYHDTPLEKRNLIEFPPNVVEFSVPRKHCLLTTRTFLRLVDDFERGKIDKRYILELFQSTSGVLELS